MMDYPKIETLYDRDEKTHKVRPDRLRCPEFSLISRWHVTEKLDGTNIRVHLASDGAVIYGGRTDNAQLHAPLVAWLQTYLSPQMVSSAFDPGTKAILFGEGYGAGIQRGGGYRPASAFRLFDVLVFPGETRWWLNWPNVEDVAAKLGILTVPVLGRDVSTDEARSMVRGPSTAAKEDGGTGCEREGIVARTEPILLLRDGTRRLMWKLKGRDF